MSSRKVVNFSVFALHAQIRNSPFVGGHEANKAMSSAEDLCTFPSFSVYVLAEENSGLQARETTGAVCATAFVKRIWKDGFVRISSIDPSSYLRLDNYRAGKYPTAWIWGSL